MATVNKNVMSGFYALAAARISLGFIFLWAFLDKMFGLGKATCADGAGVSGHGCTQAWINGGSPTGGFLSHATGPFANLYHNLAGQGWVDWLFMVGLLCIGVGLMLGIGMRLVTTAGAILLLLMWSALLWPANNPFLDEHIIYIFVLATLNVANSQQRWGLRAWWRETGLVKKFPILE